MVTSERRGRFTARLRRDDERARSRLLGYAEQPERGREGAGAGADHQQVAGADRRSGHVADNVGVEPEVHEAHAEGAHHQPLATDAVAGDAAGAVDLIAKAVRGVGGSGE